MNAKVYIGMRYWYPFTEEAVDKILEDGVNRLVILPLYPQVCSSLARPIPTRAAKRGTALGFATKRRGASESQRYAFQGCEEGWRDCSGWRWSRVRGCLSVEVET